MSCVNPRVNHRDLDQPFKQSRSNIPPSLPTLEGKDDEDACIMVSPQTQLLPFVEPPPVADVLGPGKWEYWSEEPDDLDNIKADILTKIRKACSKECL